MNLYFFFFSIVYLQKCSKFNTTKVGNNTASNFSSSFRPQNLGGTFARFFHCENNKTHSHYPINLNGQKENYKVNNYSRLNYCSRRKIAFSIWHLLRPEITMNPSPLSLHVFSSSRLKPKRKKPVPREGSLHKCHETLASLCFSGRIPSKHKHNF